MRTPILACSLLSACASEPRASEPPRLTIHHPPEPIAAPPPSASEQPISAPPPPVVEQPITVALTPQPADPSPASLAPTPGETTGPDAELYTRAATLRASGDKQGTRAALQQLLVHHPASPLVPHAYLMIGELLFEAGEPERARMAFEKVLDYPAADVTAYARYRGAWCRINLGDDAGALDAFVDAAARAGARNDEASRRLHRISLLDSTFAYARTGRLDRAAVFYARLTRDTAVPLDSVLQQLARAALDGGRQAELTRVCQAAVWPSWCAGPLDHR